MEPLLVDVPTAMSALDCGKTRFYELVKAGHITIVKMGRRSLVSPAQLNQLVGRLLQEAQAAAVITERQEKRAA